jgi:hypothetical protein
MTASVQHRCEVHSSVRLRASIVSAVGVHMCVRVGMLAPLLHVSYLDARTSGS